VDRDAVDHAVIDAFDRFTVLGFWFDPSHAKDDDAEGDSRFWWPLCDEWMARYGRRLKMWAVKSGSSRHAVAWDMSSTTRQAVFVPAVEQLEADLKAGTAQARSSSWLQQHAINAKRAPGKFGVSLRKENRESARKIDLAVCWVGARMMWRQWQLARVGDKERTGRAAFI
jgi:hypothetical protein